MQINGLGIALNEIDPDQVKKNIHTLNKRERYIIENLMGYRGPVKSLNSIAEELEISRERARQIAIIAIGKMDAATQEDKDDVVDQMMYIVQHEYGGEIPSSLDIKINHVKLYWKIRGTFGEYRKVQSLVKQRLDELYVNGSCDS